jgi:hypothetical protein
MRERVFDQMGSGLAALVRVSMGVAAESSPAPIPNKRDIADITMEDLEQVRRMLQLTSLPFHNTYDEDLQRLTNILRVGSNSFSLPALLRCTESPNSCRMNSVIIKVVCTGIF